MLTMDNGAGMKQGQSRHAGRSAFHCTCNRATSRLLLSHSTGTKQIAFAPVCIATAGAHPANLQSIVFVHIQQYAQEVDMAMQTNASVASSNAPSELGKPGAMSTVWLSYIMWGLHNMHCFSHHAHFALHLPIRAPHACFCDLPSVEAAPAFDRSAALELPTSCLRTGAAACRSSAALFPALLLCCGPGSLGMWDRSNVRSRSTSLNQWRRSSTPRTVSG